MALATHDIELVEYFFAHTVAPAFVAILVPAAVIAVLATESGWRGAGTAAFPGLAVGLSPFLMRGRVDRLGARAREASGELGAFTVDSVQGLGEIVAFQQEAPRGEELAARSSAYAEARMPFLADLARQSALQEVATGLGGLAVTLVGAWLVAAGRSTPRCCRCSPCSRCPPSCRSRRSRRSAASSPTRSRPPAASTRCTASRCASPTVRAFGPAPPGGGRHRARRGHLHVPGPAPARAAGRVLHGPRRRDGRAGRHVRRRQDHDGATAAALLGSGHGRHDAERPRPARLAARRSRDARSRWSRRTPTCSTTRSARQHPDARSAATRRTGSCRRLAERAALRELWRIAAGGGGHGGGRARHAASRAASASGSRSRARS